MSCCNSCRLNHQGQLGPRSLPVEFVINCPLSVTLVLLGSNIDRIWRNKSIIPSDMSRTNIHDFLYRQISQFIVTRPDHCYQLTTLGSQIWQSGTILHSEALLPFPVSSYQGRDPANSNWHHTHLAHKKKQYFRWMIFGFSWSVSCHALPPNPNVPRCC